MSAANHLGNHALYWYAAVLLTLLCLSAICYNMPACRKPQFASLVVLAGATVFSCLAWGLLHSTCIDAFDQALTTAIAAYASPITLQVFAVITHLGDSLTFTLLCCVMAVSLLLGRHYVLALGTVVAIGGNSLVNVTLKSLFERGRPLHAHDLMQADGWSFPSGHSSGSVVAYGMLAYVLITLSRTRKDLPNKRTAEQASNARKIHHAAIDKHPMHLSLVLCAVTVAFTVGYSRIFLQVHYASDVLAGWMSGIVWLTLCIGMTERIGSAQFANATQQGAGSKPS